MYEKLKVQFFPTQQIYVLQIWPKKTFLLILRKSTTLNLLGIECLYYSIRFLQFLLCLPSNKKRLHHFIPGRGPMDFCPGMARCPSNSEGRGRKSALSDKVFGPLLTKACGACTWLRWQRAPPSPAPPPGASLASISARTPTGRKSSQYRRPSNHFQQAKWLCNFMLKLFLHKYLYTMVGRPFSRPLTSYHILPQITVSNLTCE